MSYHCFISCHVMSCHVMSCHVMSCHTIPYHVISCVIGLFLPAFNKVGAGAGVGKAGRRVKYVFLGLRRQLRYQAERKKATDVVFSFEMWDICKRRRKRFWLAAWSIAFRGDFNILWLLSQKTKASKSQVNIRERFFLNRTYSLEFFRW
jgi:hypothetical protein